MGATRLLEHVYYKHPPTGVAPPGKDAMRGDRLADTLKKARVHYHPDKQHGKPRKWQLIAEAITKALNAVA